jgi:hypothetical protein
MRAWRDRFRRRQPALPELNDPSSQFGISQFDTVRVVRADETEALGYAGRTGTCYGFTTPSATGIDSVIGGTEADIAFNVHFDEDDAEDAWFAPNLVEYAGFTAGMTMSLGGKTFVRQPDGEWVEQAHEASPD